MSNYKDFSTFNRDADDIRPTGRIQLIQRILNAASLISNLSAGVPLRWANAYKSFQVLKPVSNADPEDVTTQEAVSAVDSVLYEAHSQLEASWDDLKTLRSELEKMPLTGRASWAAYPKWPANSYVRVCGVRIAGEICSLCVYTDGNSDLHNTLFLMSFPHFQSLKNAVVADGSNTSIIRSHGGNLGGRNIVSTSGRVSASGDSDVYDFSILAGYNDTDTIIEFKLINIHFKSDSSADVYPATVNFTVTSAPQGSDIQTYQLVDTTSTTGIFAGLAASQSLIVNGSLETGEALGLPDPTTVIADIENLL